MSGVASKVLQFVTEITCFLVFIIILFSVVFSTNSVPSLQGSPSGSLPFYSFSLSSLLLHTLLSLLHPTPSSPFFPPILFLYLPSSITPLLSYLNLNRWEASTRRESWEPGLLHPNLRHPHLGFRREEEGAIPPVLQRNGPSGFPWNRGADGRHHWCYQKAYLWNLLLPERAKGGGVANIPPDPDGSWLLQ